MVNKVTLIGNLGRDPEIRRLESGAVVAQFSVATNENYKDKDGNWQTQTEWHNVVAWRSLAEQAERNFKKGSLVYIEGKLTHRKYQDANQADRYITEVVANYMRGLEKREGGGQFNPPPISSENEPANYRQSASSGAEHPQMAEAGAPPPVEGDLPF